MAAAEGVATAYWVNNDRFLNHLNAYLPQRPWQWLMGMLICILKICSDVFAVAVPLTDCSMLQF